ncbi:alpha/beta fold hydrolase [Pseudomonas phytophila]|uniref:Alpha/beta fold hydrolase n=1 Tax=Pseudomonas phytophila TaxID=2867264 RepID=A0ABY6FJ42_9PSED|nr:MULTISPECIES: alpha/beta fold hydrolase [Pseudomonas]PHN27905.1 thioesterase [Pseudomonas sp. ICMP 561]UXZ97950.1 alpha/beta fold hydrolase [Pseudomonas phytophila]
MQRPALRLFCLPYSGASAMVYLRWRRSLPAWIEVCPLELPGRGRRFNEPLQTDMPALVAQLAVELEGRLDLPYVLFGHSLGALLAFELAHALRRKGAPPARALFVSGAPAPAHREYHTDLQAEQSDEQLLARLRQLGGTDEAVFADPEMLLLTLPVLRADFLLCGRYRYDRRALLSSPIHVFGGKQDRMSVEALSAWQNETAEGFSLEMFDGDHFFINAHEAHLLELMVERLQPVGPVQQPVTA